MVPVVHSGSHGSRKATRAEEGPRGTPKQRPKFHKTSIMVFTPKAGTGTVMATAESVDKARSQRHKGARATQHHAVGAPPQRIVVESICPQPSETAGNHPVHSTDSRNRTRHDPRQSGQLSGPAVGTSKCADHKMMRTTEGRAPRQQTLRRRR